ncbi:XRE family transcriptional regulator [Nocardioides sp. NPDC004968]|uniref:helix-turn-helix domain-containing protein n=1 Tax=Nocardioides sp. NPDC004968 TaxID=3155894 RepID=UPI0033AF6E71
MTSSITFEGDRLRQARQLAMMTKKDVAELAEVSQAAVGQYEAGVAVPRPDTLERLATALDVPVGFFAPGRPHQRLDTSETFFESLRATTARQQHRATSFAEQVWELSNALEAHVRFPQINLPDLHAEDRTYSPQEAAQEVRKLWDLGAEPIGHLVAQMEAHGIICAMAPPSDREDKKRIDAYSTRAFSRPLVILTADRADDVLRHRFSAAHELGHLLLHNGEASGELVLEREADAFAAEFLTPRAVLREELPQRLDFAKLYRISERWGVEVRSLIYRSQELGHISESTARRAYIRLNEAKQPPRSIRQYDGEVPSMLNAAFELAAGRGVTVGTLADQLKWKPARVRELLGQEDDPRPALRLVI